VLEDEEVRGLRAGYAKKSPVVIFHNTGDLLVIGEFHANGDFLFNQVLQILDFLESLFRRPGSFQFGIQHDSIYGPFAFFAGGFGGRTVSSWLAPAGPVEDPEYAGLPSCRASP
jgi:hypothetical protein